MNDRFSEHKTNPKRIVALVVLVVVLFGVFSLRLFQIQVVDGDYYAEMADNTTMVNLSLDASRGEILDRYLRPVVVNQTSYSVILDYNYFPRGSSEEKQREKNTCLLALTELLSAEGEEWNDTLPISASAPYSFLEEREASVEALREHLGLREYATAEQCMAAMIEDYGLEEYPATTQRTLAGIRYEMQLREFSTKNPFVFATGVAKSTMYKVVENEAQYPGVEVQITPVRKYAQGEVAAHLIGTVGPIYAEEYAELKEQGYALNDTLGKSGIEAAMESALRGTDGVRTLTKNESGKVVSETVTTQPIPGDTVVLTLDTALQQAAQQALTDIITEYRALPKTQGNGHDVASGSVVVLDMTGGVRTCASWPSYDLSTYTQNYEQLLADPDNPLFNRALYGLYQIGSTAKPGVALAALTEGTLAPDGRVTCNYRYTYYSDYQPVCMHTHGGINVVTALEKSCNVFFYDTGRVLGIDLMNNYFARYGFGQKTGIEIGESAGVLDGPDYRASIGGSWTGGDTLRAAIGQTAQFTPIQLATYTMTMANGGTRYQTHLVHSVRSFDGSEETVIQPTVLDKANWSDEAMALVKQGMKQVVQPGGTAYSSFSTANYTLAAKTGTAETGVDGESDHGVFIAYAPADDPQIAIAVMMENGTSKAASRVGRQVLDAYFDEMSSTVEILPENELLP